MIQTNHTAFFYLRVSSKARLDTAQNLILELSNKAKYNEDKIYCFFFNFRLCKYITQTALKIPRLF